MELKPRDLVRVFNEWKMVGRTWYLDFVGVDGGMELMIVIEQLGIILFCEGGMEMRFLWGELESGGPRTGESGRNKKPNIAPLGFLV